MSKAKAVGGATSSTVVIAIRIALNKVIDISIHSAVSSAVNNAIDDVVSSAIHSAVYREINNATTKPQPPHIIAETKRIVNELS